jgi:glycosyltransferase involved in cell wall biosynthesis
MITTNSVKRFFEKLDRIRKDPLDSIPKKVILTSTCLDLTGAQRQLTNTAIEIKKILNSPMAIFFMSRPHPKAELLVQDLVQHGIGLSVFENFSNKLPLKFSPLGESLRQFHQNDQIMIATFYEVFMKERPEVVHAWGLATGAIVAVAGLMAGVPKIVVGWRGMSPLKNTSSPQKNSFCHHREVYRQFLRYPQIKFMANSQVALNDYAKWMKCDPKRFKLVRNALNTDFLEKFPVYDLRVELKIPSDKIVVGGMFRFHSDKHPELWIETARILAQKNPDLIFLLAGEGELIPKIQEMIKEYGLQDKFFLLGRHVNVKSFYESLDCFLLTSRLEGEGLPNVLVEAQYFGVPTVTTRGGGAEETLAEGTGVLCRKNDPQEIAQAVEGILSKKLNRKALQKTYKAFVDENFSLSSLGKKFLDVYGFQTEKPLKKQLTEDSVQRFFQNLNQIKKAPFEPIPKKVILISTVLDLTGAQRQLTNTAIEIKKKLQSPMSIFFLGLPNEKAKFLVEALTQHGIDLGAFNKLCHELPFHFSPLKESLEHLSPKEQVMISTMYHVFMRDRPEIVHSWGAATGATLAVAGLMAGVSKIVISWRNMSPGSKNSVVYENSFCHDREVFRQLSAYPQVKFLAISEAVRQDYAKWIGCSSSRIDLISCGLNTDFLESFPSHDLRAELNIPLDKKVVGGMFRFHPDKHPELWIETARVLVQKRKDLIFILAGEGELVPKIQKMIEGYNLKPYFFYLGKYVNVKAFYESLDCFLLTSRTEGLGNVLLEAQYFGIPTVTTAADGPAIETLAEGTGVLCKDDPYALAQALEEALNKKTDRESLRRVYKSFVDENFSLKDLGKKFVQAYGV